MKTKVRPALLILKSIFHVRKHMDPKPLPAWPLNFDPREQLYQVKVYTHNAHTSTLTFHSFNQAKDFQEKLNKHNLTRKANEPEPISA